jgi:hypothetical protein
MTGEEWLLAIVSALMGATVLLLFQWILASPRRTRTSEDQLRELRRRLGDPLATQVTIRRDLLAALVYDASAGR